MLEILAHRNNAKARTSAGNVLDELGCYVVGLTAGAVSSEALEGNLVQGLHFLSETCTGIVGLTKSAPNNEAVLEFNVASTDALCLGGDKFEALGEACR